MHLICVVTFTFAIIDSYVIFSIIASAGTQALITNWILSTLQCFVTLNVQVYSMKSYIMHPSIYGSYVAMAAWSIIKVVMLSWSYQDSR